MKSRFRWDIFCTVVDNFGDIGVCWRLARQLAAEHELQVRLWVDELTPLASICPDVDIALAVQSIAGVEIRHWPPAFPDAEVEAAGVVIEAFACELPAVYVAAMAKRDCAPVWINLEYLSAEDWVDSAHGLPSPHPRLPLTKYFFFPGFSAKTGGLIREANYDKRKADFDEADFRTRLGLPAKRKDELTISLFGYENLALPALLNAWTQSPQPVTCLLPEGRLLPDVQAFFCHQGTQMQRGHLTVHVIPFLPQQEYDALLWLCDLNFVRGEDSFVRAQWAEKPFVWHIYPQTDGVHMVKLEAFLSRYLSALPAAAINSVRDFWTSWNDSGDTGAAWPAYARSLPVLREHATTWAGGLAAHGDLAANLLHFAQQKAGN